MACATCSACRARAISRRSTPSTIATLRSRSAGMRAARRSWRKPSARHTGRPGICFVTRGPGATNAAAGLHIARQDSTPMILFVGQVARDMREREAFQELDYRAVFGSVAKWATEIDDPARIPELVSRAFYTATNGRPGPVVIALPEDMLVERVTVADAPAFEPVETWPGRNRHEPAAEAVAGRPSARSCCSAAAAGRRPQAPRSRALPSVSRCRSRPVPPRASLRSDACLLCGRSRHRAQSRSSLARVKKADSCC